MTTDWPIWWQWPIEVSTHAFRRMVDRQFTEVDLRLMLADATSIKPDIVPGRWVAEARHDSRAWEVIIEPDEVRELQVIITAYPVQGPTDE